MPVKMPVYQLFIINRAGSLIFSYDGAPKLPELEKTFSLPLDLSLAYVDKKPTVVFGQRDGIKVGYVLVAVNGQTLGSGGRLVVAGEGGEEGEGEVEVLEWLGRGAAGGPVSLRFARLGLNANEKIILSSMFHSLHTIGAQLSPLSGSSGIKVVETAAFRLECFSTPTGLKFVVVTEPGSGGMEILLRRLYELYADFALKNPFYSLDMPIRCAKFDTAIEALLAKFEKSSTLI